MKSEKLRKLHIIILFLFTTCFFPSLTFSEENNIWNRIAGNWEVTIENGKPLAIQRRIKAVQWNYHLPFNYSSLASIQDFPHYSSIQYSFSIMNQTSEPELLLFIAAELSEKSRYHNLAAFRLSGNPKEIIKATFLKSSLIDPSRMGEKGNFKVDEISFSNCSVPLDQKFICEIKVDRATATLFINGKTIHSQKSIERLDHGIIGFGIRNAQLKVYEVKIFDGRKLLLHDDFSKDSIKVLKAVMQKISPEEFERIKREEDKKKKK